MRVSIRYILMAMLGLGLVSFLISVSSLQSKLGPTLSATLHVSYVNTSIETEVQRLTYELQLMQEELERVRSSETHALSQIWMANAKAAQARATAEDLQGQLDDAAYNHREAEKEFREKEKEVSRLEKIVEQVMQQKEDCERQKDVRPGKLDKPGGVAPDRPDRPGPKEVRPNEWPNDEPIDRVSPVPELCLRARETPGLISAQCFVGVRSSDRIGARLAGTVVNLAGIRATGTLGAADDKDGGQHFYNWPQMTEIWSLPCDFEMPPPHRPDLLANTRSNIFEPQMFTRNLEPSSKRSALVVIPRHDYANPYHVHASMISAWMTLASIGGGFDTRRADILFADEFAPSVMEAGWAALFSTESNLFRVETLFGVAGPRPLYNDVLLLRAAESWEGLGLEDMKNFAMFVKCRLGIREPPGDVRRTLTFVWRKPYLRFQGPNGAKLARLVVNEEEVKQFLDRYEKKLRIQHVDFAQMSFAEQVAVAAASDILVGVHGAGLVNCLYMRPGTHLIQIDAGHFAGMFTPQARAAGVHHTIVPNPATHDQEAVTIDCRELGTALDAVLAGRRYKSPDPYEDRMLRQKWPALFDDDEEW